MVKWVLINGYPRRLKPEVSLETLKEKHPEADIKSIKAPPSMTTIDKWLDEGLCKATDGCRVELDGTCPHGHKSWLLVMGAI
jgi:hypothetical protein